MSDKSHKTEKKDKKKKEPSLINDSFVQEIKITKSEARSIISSN